MKRTFQALLSVLVLGLIGLASSTAQAAVTCPNKAVAGYTKNVLYVCTGVTTPDSSSAVIAMQGLQTKAKLANDTTLHQTYIFALETDYQPYTVANPGGLPYLNPGSAEGNTWKDASGNWWSVVFIDRLSSVSTKHTENAVAHEQGHFLDFWYSATLGGAQSGSEDVSSFAIKLTGAQFTVAVPLPFTAGTISATFNVMDGLKNSPTYATYVDNETISKTTVAADTAVSLAAYFVDQINNHSNLPTNGVTAVATTPASATFYIHSKNITRYSVAHTGSALFDMTNDKTNFHDWSVWINRSAPYGTDAQCNSTGSGIFNGQKDSAGSYICTGATGGGATLSATYFGKNNGQIMLIAWAYFYQQISDYGIPRWAELWAEDTAKATGQTEGKPSPDFALTSNFQCISEALTWVYTKGSNWGTDDTGFSPACKGF